MAKRIRMQLCRSLLLDFVIAAALLVPAYFLYHTSISGDASIYFTFIKNFFSLPFSFHPSAVSFGATSPLHVVMHAPIHRILREEWFPASQVLNFMLILVGIVFLKRAIQGSYSTLLLLSTFTLTAKPLLVATCQLYESSLVFLSLSVVYYLLKKSRLWQAVLIAGSLYLVRPELLLVTLAVDAYALFTSHRRILLAGVALSSFCPVLLYHAYVFFHTGQLLPSSVVARGLRALEDTAPWLNRARSAMSHLAGPPGYSYLLGTVSLCALGMRKLRSHTVEILLFLPLPLLFLAVPPHDYMPRYLLPILPIAAATTTLAAESLWRSILVVLSRLFRRPEGVTEPWRRRSLAVFAVLSALAVYGRYLAAAENGRRYDYDTLLLKDLSSHLNRIATSQDKVILYEIQAQYYLSAYCISLDCIVGNSMLEVYRGNETLPDFIRREKVKYIVTMNSFNYRRAFNNTLLEDLYVHDLASRTGDVFTAEGLAFTKILTNEAFSDPRRYELRPWNNLNAGSELRVYNESNALWTGHPPMWNSVYRIHTPDSERKRSPEAQETHTVRPPA